MPCWRPLLEYTLSYEIVITMRLNLRIKFVSFIDGHDTTD